MDTTKLTLFSLITKEIALKILTFLFLVCNIQVKILKNLTVSPIVVQDSMKLYNNKELMELLGVKDRYLKKLRDNGYLGYSREGDKYWYTQKDVDCFLRSFHYEPFNRDRNKLWTL